MRVLLLLLMLFGAGYSCSCYPVLHRRYVCDGSHILRIKPVEVLNVEEWGNNLEEEHDPFDFLETPHDVMGSEDPDFPTEPVFLPTPMIPVTDSYSRWMMGKTTVRCEVTHAYRGGLEPGHNITITTSNMDSMCGVGNMFYDFELGHVTNEEFVIATHDPDNTRVDLCGFFIPLSSNWYSFATDVEPVLKHHDCSCPPRGCRLRVGNQVFRGDCGDPTAYCVRDERDRCMWESAYTLSSIQMCRDRWWSFH